MLYLVTNRLDCSCTIHNIENEAPGIEGGSSGHAQPIYGSIAVLLEKLPRQRDVARERWNPSVNATPRIQGLEQPALLRIGVEIEWHRRPTISRSSPTGGHST